MNIDNITAIELVGATKKKLVGVKLSEGELREMIRVSGVDAGAAAILALARIGAATLSSRLGIGAEEVER